MERDGVVVWEIHPIGSSQRELLAIEQAGRLWLVRILTLEKKCGLGALYGQIDELTGSVDLLPHLVDGDGLELVGTQCGAEVDLQPPWFAGDFAGELAIDLESNCGDIAFNEDLYGVRSEN
jgi:hypothetical protein